MIKTFNCPSCNAALDVPDWPGPTLRCPYCSSTVMVPDELRLPSDSPATESRPGFHSSAEIRKLLLGRRKIEAIKLYRQVYGVGLKEAKEAVEKIEASIEGRPIGEATSKAGTRGCAGPLAFLLLAVALGFALVYGLAGEANPLRQTVDDLKGVVSTANRVIGGMPYFIAGIDGAAPDIVFQVQNLDDDTESMAYYDGAAGDLRWESASVARATPIPLFTADESRIFVVSARALRAYDRATGTFQWEATLSDQVHSICRDCLQSFGRQFVILTADGYLQGFESETGNQLWRSKIDPVSSRRVFSFPQYVGVMNESDETGMAIEIIEPENGSVVRRLAPRCPHPTFDPQEPKANDPVIVDSAKGTLTVLFGFFEPGCIQQYDFDDGRLIWDRFSDLTSFSSTDRPLNGRDAIYVTDDQATTLYAVNKAEGNVTLLSTEDEYQLSPLAESANLLLVRATRRRGTKRDELWAIDTTSGGVIWRHIPQAPEMMPLGEEEVVWESGEGYWHSHLTSKGISLIQARHQPARFIFQTVDPLNGASSDQIELPVDGQFESNYRVSVIGWQGSTAWLKVDLRRIWAVDTTTAELVSHWP